MERQYTLFQFLLSLRTVFIYWQRITFIKTRDLKASLANACESKISRHPKTVEVTITREKNKWAQVLTWQIVYEAKCCPICFIFSVWLQKKMGRIVWKVHSHKNLVAFFGGGGVCLFVCFSVVADPVITEESCCYWCQLCHVKCSEAHLKPSRLHWLLGVNCLWTAACHLQLRVILWIIRLFVFSTGTCTFLWVDEVSKYLPFNRQTSTSFLDWKHHDPGIKPALGATAQKKQTQHMCMSSCRATM